MGASDVDKERRRRFIQGTQQDTGRTPTNNPLVALKNLQAWARELNVLPPPPFLPNLESLSIPSPRDFEDHNDPRDREIERLTAEVQALKVQLDNKSPREEEDPELGPQSVKLIKSRLNPEVRRYDRQPKPR